MTNKNYKSLTSILSGLILAATTACSVQAQGGPVSEVRYNRDYKALEGKPAQTLSGVIRVKKEFGVIPHYQGAEEAGSPCGQFYVAVLDPDNGNRAITTTTTDAGRDDGEFYTCKYSFKVPANKRLYAIAGMGGSLLLPKQSRDEMYITDKWIGGTNNKPRRGYERGFGGKFVTLGIKGMYLKFDMYYAQVDPN